MISKVQATVYQVGRRRFLTERAAFAHMVRLRLAVMRPCACETAEYDGPYCTSRGFTCPIHDEQVRKRYARLLRSAWKRGMAKERDPTLHILQHALGLDDYGQGTYYRNRYVATADSEDFRRCQGHVAAGRMVRHGPSDLFGGGQSYCFVVTDAGKRYVKEQSPSPPRLTRSQKRYREYLLMDSGLKFGEWLRSEWARG